MTDPLDRIADALELLALTTWNDSPGPDMVCDALASRIEARHAAAQQTPGDDAARAGESSHSNRVAPSGGDSGHFLLPPDDDPEWRDVPAERSTFHSLRLGDRWWFGDRGPWMIARGAGAPDEHTATRWIKRHDHPGRKPAPQTVDVLGSALRFGDHLVGTYNRDGTFLPYGELESIVTPAMLRHAHAELRYRVRLPRPAAEPSASGEGIASTRPHSPNLHLLGDARAWFVGDVSEPVALVAAINAAHAHATREMRERCERAERDLAFTTNALTHEHILARAQNERCERAEAIAADDRTLTETRIKLADARESWDAAAKARDEARAARDAAIARAETAERVVEAVRVWDAYRQEPTATHVSLRQNRAAMDAALREYDAARKDGAK